MAASNFLVSHFEIEETVDRIQGGAITGYMFDPKWARPGPDMER